MGRSVLKVGVSPERLLTLCYIHPHASIVERGNTLLCSQCLGVPFSVDAYRKAYRQRPETKALKRVWRQQRMKLLEYRPSSPFLKALDACLELGEMGR